MLIPVLRVAPALYRLRMRLRIGRSYRLLLFIERDIVEDGKKEGRNELLEKLDRLEAQVNRMKVPASFGDQFYVLREHIRFVHDRLADSAHVHT